MSPDATPLVVSPPDVVKIARSNVAWREYMAASDFLGTLADINYPTHFAVLEDPRVVNGGRHEYGLRTLHCDRHIEYTPSRTFVRAGCGRRSPHPLQREDKRRAAEAAAHRAIMGWNIGRAYLAPLDLEEGDWLPSWVPTLEEGRC